MIPIPLVCKLVAATLAAASPGDLPAPSDPAAQAAEAVQVAGTGTIVGKVLFEGITPPKRRIIPLTAPEVCGGMREEDRIVLSPERDVQGAIVYLKHVGQGKAWSKPASLPKIEKHRCGFRPGVQVVPVGDIELVNADPIPHKIRLSRDGVNVLNLDLGKHQRITKSLAEAGLYRLGCDAHAWERGWVYAVENPYYDQTRDDGSFRIPEVPPGHYTLVVWHAYTGEEPIPVTVAANGVVSVGVTLKR
jgi:hypothetical protein